MALKNVKGDDMLERYRRAAMLDHGDMVYQPSLMGHISANWIDNESFWYVRHQKAGREYRRVDAVQRINEPLFDHEKLAALLSEASGETVEKFDLPLKDFSAERGIIKFAAFTRLWTYDGKLSDVGPFVPHPPHWLVSPNGKTAAFTREHNLWLRDIASGDERPLTKDGEQHYAYAIEPEARNLVHGLKVNPDFRAPEPRPDAAWSPDGRYLFTFQLDERQTATMPSILFAPQDGSLRPVTAECRYPLPGDKHIPTYRFVILDAESSREISADYPLVEDSFIALSYFSGNRAWWSGDGSRAYFLDMARGQKSVRVVEVSASTGKTRVLFEEYAETYLEIGHEIERPTDIIPIPDTDELIWFSQRTGYGHLYLYNLKTGALNNAITAGDWSVAESFSFDAERREVYALIMGRVPGRYYYYREIARVHVDTGEMSILSSGDYDFELYGVLGERAGPSPGGDYLVATHSRVDTPAVADLRDRDGNILLELEKSDLSQLPKHWRWPEPFQSIAADGKTPTYGVMFKPSDFDPDKKYPVLDFSHINSFYAGTMPRTAFASYVSAMAGFAELGLIVLSLNGRGTGYRDRAFREYGFDDFLEQGGLVDHVAGMRRLAAEKPYMDLDRVGIIDFDGSNAGVVGLLKFPEFFKVGVAGSIYDPRLVKQGEVYSGITTKEKRQSVEVWGEAVHNLKGKLLIQTGLCDRFFHPSATFHLTDQLIKANRDFEHLVQPNGAHAWRLINARRRIWDFLVRYLIGETPPDNFEMMSAGEYLNIRLNIGQIAEVLNIADI